MCISFCEEAVPNYFSRNSSDVCGIQGQSARTVTGKTDRFRKYKVAQ